MERTKYVVCFQTTRVSRCPLPSIKGLIVSFLLEFIYPEPTVAMGIAHTDNITFEAQRV